MLDLLEAYPSQVWQELYEKACDRLFLLDNGKRESTQLMVLALVLWLMNICLGKDRPY